MFENIIHKICSHPHLIERPIVLMDIGASETLHAVWKEIAKYSICIGIDADSRDFDETDHGNSHFKKLVLINKIVSDTEQDKQIFFLTHSPYCSSTLKPEAAALDCWHFYELFKINEAVYLPSTTLHEILNHNSINYVDWFKVDSQGTDLRLFKSLPDSIRTGITTCDMEPGIIDAYKEEDKLWDILPYMFKTGYWLANMEVKGTKMTYPLINGKGTLATVYEKMYAFTPDAPCWTELCFVKKPEYIETGHIRQLLVAILFGCLKGQLGYVMQVIKLGSHNTNDPIFEELHECMVQHINEQMNKRINNQIPKRLSLPERIKRKLKAIFKLGITGDAMVALKND